MLCVSSSRSVDCLRLVRVSGGENMNDFTSHTDSAAPLSVTDNIATDVRQFDTRTKLEHVI